MTGEKRAYLPTQQADTYELEGNVNIGPIYLINLDDRTESAVMCSGANYRWGLLVLSQKGTDICWHRAF